MCNCLASDSELQRWDEYFGCYRQVADSLRRLLQEKQGRGFSRVPVWGDCFVILLFRRADLGVVAEVEIVALAIIEVDPTLNESV